MNQAVQGSIAHDLLVGAGQIAEFLFGEDNEAERRRVHRMCREGDIPTFKLGGSIAARKHELNFVLSAMKEPMTA